MSPNQLHPLQDRPNLTGAMDPSESMNQPAVSRVARKARKLLEKVDLQKVDDIQRICIRKAKDTLFFIDKPEVGVESVHVIRPLLRPSHLGVQGSWDR
jgi:NAC domain